MTACGMFLHLFIQMMAAPGDKITFVIKMFDQNSNRREGIWGFRLSDVHRANITHGEMVRVDTVLYTYMCRETHSV